MLISHEINVYTRSLLFEKLLICWQQLEAVPLLPDITIQEMQMALLGMFVIDCLTITDVQTINDLLWAHLLCHIQVTRDNPVQPALLCGGGVCMHSSRDTGVLPLHDDELD